MHQDAALVEIPDGQAANRAAGAARREDDAVRDAGAGAIQHDRRTAAVSRETVVGRRVDGDRVGDGQRRREVDRMHACAGNRECNAVRDAHRGVRLCEGIPQRARAGIVGVGDGVRGQRSRPRRLRSGIDDHAGFDGAGSGFQVPVGAAGVASRAIDARRNVGARQLRKRLHRQLTGRPRAETAAVDQDVGVGREALADLCQRPRILRADGLLSQEGRAEMQLGRVAFADQVDGVDAGAALQRVSNLGDAILAGIDDDDLRSRIDAVHQLLVVLDPRIDEDDFLALVGDCLRGRRDFVARGGLINQRLVEKFLRLMLQRQTRRNIGGQQYPGLEFLQPEPVRRRPWRAAGARINRAALATLEETEHSSLSGQRAWATVPRRAVSGATVGNAAARPRRSRNPGDARRGVGRP